MSDVCRITRHVIGIVLSVIGAVALATADTPARTTISDTIYRADGAPAAGTLLISWPAFTTAAGLPVASGNTSVTIGAGGTVTVALVPNADATPAGTLYTIVYRLSDNTTATEYWTVGATSPATIASVRTTPGSGTAAQMVTRQYLNSYVDAAVAAAGSGNYVNKGGDTMTGPLTLPGEPGRISLMEQKICALEKSDVRRSVHDRILNAIIAVLVSAAIALHDHLGLK